MSLRENQGRLTRAAPLRWLVLFVLLLAAGRPAEARTPLTPAAQVVGDGDPAHCTQSALANALAVGGDITFNCGAAPTTIFFATPIVITVTASLNGADLITFSGNNATRLFRVAAGFSLSLSHLSLTNAAYTVDDGGAIRVEDTGALHVDHTTFRHNQVDSQHSGGAILNLGTLTIDASTFEDNQAGNGGALFPRFAASRTTITNSVFIHNTTLNTTDGWGGAMLIWDGAPVTVSGSQFISNTARWGGAIYVFLASYLTMTTSALSYNVADGGASADGGGGAIYSNASVTLIDTTLDHNMTVVPAGFGFPGIRAGGAIWNSSAAALQITRGALEANRALRGGALYNLGNGSLITTTLAGNLAGSGGAIFNANNAGNTLTINGSTLSDNQVSFAAYPAITTPLGGAIFNTAHLIMTNSTLSGNSGSVALQEDNSLISLSSVTIAHNANGGLGSDQSPNSSNVALANTLLADNGNYNCGPILFGTFTSHNSLSSNATCSAWVGSQNQNSVDPQISPLGNHGGPTDTIMIVTDSPAQDAGASCPGFDQRGVSRPQRNACDIGAVERLASDAFYNLFLPLARR